VRLSAVNYTASFYSVACISKASNKKQTGMARVVSGQLVHNAEGAETQSAQRLIEIKQEYFFVFSAPLRSLRLLNQLFVASPRVCEVGGLH
jgi:hypothetical protein